MRLEGQERKFNRWMSFLTAASLSGHLAHSFAGASWTATTRLCVCTASWWSVGSPGGLTSGGGAFWVVWRREIRRFRLHRLLLFGVV